MVQFCFCIIPFEPRTQEKNIRRHTKLFLVGSPNSHLNRLVNSCIIILASFLTSKSYKLSIRFYTCLNISLGFIGGMFSALAGSGVDICSFSVLCLLFRISEKVATPTSVVLMAINTCVGLYWRQLMTDGNFILISDYMGDHFEKL